MQVRTLHLKNVTKSFAGRKVVDIDNITFGNHGIEGLIGPNGAGKTTLMSLITSKLKLDTGQVIYSGKSGETDITKRGLDELARMGIVRTNQLIQDFESLSIKDSLRLALAQPRQEQFYRIFNPGKLDQQFEVEIKEYLDYFRFENPDGHALSAGEKKLLDMIRVLLLKPKFLLMDEPTAGLPEDQTKKVMDLMVKKAVEEDMSILIVEHDLDLIWRVCEYVHFMAEGRILVQGSPEKIRKNRMVAEKYLGATNV